MPLRCLKLMRENRAAGRVFFATLRVVKGIASDSDLARLAVVLGNSISVRLMAAALSPVGGSLARTGEGVRVRGLKVYDQRVGPSFFSWPRTMAREARRIGPAAPMRMIHSWMTLGLLRHRGPREAAVHPARTWTPPSQGLAFLTLRRCRHRTADVLLMLEVIAVLCKALSGPGGDAGMLEKLAKALQPTAAHIAAVRRRFLATGTISPDCAQSVVWAPSGPAADLRGRVGGEPDHGFDCQLSTRRGHCRLGV